ncbi:MAG TPA: DUF2760 domain-containing protein [Pirellulales bacterium]|nr:DUF2760 domain-containing protein [Pirellulales bacterium]
MHRLSVALRAFFRVLFDGSIAARVEAALAGTAVPGEPEAKTPEPKSTPAVARPTDRRDALLLLSLLQREARFVDFVQENLSGYNDAQVGAAARDVQRHCSAVIERAFALRPVIEGAEGSEQTIATGYDAACYKLSGNVTGEPPYRGKLCHHGWQATRIELPEWTGSAAAARTIAPAEIEL